MPKLDSTCSQPVVSRRILSANTNFSLLEAFFAFRENTASFRLRCRRRRSSLCRSVPAMIEVLLADVPKNGIERSKQPPRTGSSPVDFLIRIARSGVIEPEPAVWWMKIVVRRQKVNGSPVGLPPWVPVIDACWLDPLETDESSCGSSTPGCSTAGLGGKMAIRKRSERFWRKPLALARASPALGGA